MISLSYEGKNFKVKSKSDLRWVNMILETGGTQNVDRQKFDMTGVSCLGLVAGLRSTRGGH